MGKRTNLPTIVTLFCDNLGKKLGPAKLIKKDISCNTKKKQITYLQS